MIVRMGYVSIIVFLLALVLLAAVYPVGAQDVSPAGDVDDVVLAMSVGQLVGFIMGLVGLVASVVAVVVAWVRTSPAQRTVTGLDAAVAGAINTAATNPALVTPLEGVTNGMDDNTRGLIVDVAKLVLQAAMWTPAKSDDALAALFGEVTDGTALEDKLKAMEADVAALGAYREAIYPKTSGDLGAVPKDAITGGGL